ncbi:MAG TPA: transglutaminase-like domain-containing protein [Candidatus Angelobacter sp.]|jgi:transglutaminase-like putative cysteine protease|nr:transglutaminase-like domain-containing protein [Candidatus Angelobacter sp.]
MSATTLRLRTGGAAPLPRLTNITVVGLATLGMVAATAWAVMSAAWVDGTGAMLVCAVAAVLEATLVARSSASRVVALLMLPVVGALVVVPLTYGSIPGSDTISLGDAAQKYASALTTGLFVQGDWPFLVGLCGVFWLVGSWSGWLAVRERRGVLAVIPCFAVLAVNALNAPSLQNVWFPEAVAVALALVVVGRVHLLSLSARWRRTGVVALPGTERRFGRVTWAAALLLLLVALVVPPVSSRDISGSLFHFSSSSGHRGSLGSGSGSGGTGTGPGQIRFDPNAVPGGQLTSDPQPVLSYTSDSAASFYLRVVNDDYFTSGNWFPTGPQASTAAGVGDGEVGVTAGQIPRDRVPADGGVAKPGTVAPVSTRIVLSGAATGSGAPLGIFPGEPDAISVDGNASGLVDTGAAPGPGGQSSLLTVDQFRTFGSVTGYTTTGTQTTASANQLRAAGTDYPAFVRGTYLSLNPVTRSDFDQVATLTRIAKDWTATATTPYDAAAAIESRLRDTVTFTYTLKPPPTQSGVWPVIDFLTRTRKGYCQYFADAMGALLRADGIPARLVSGYGPGSVDDSSSRPGPALHQVTTSDAHVWVEAYFPGFGWVPFEPTPDGTYSPIPRGPDPSTVAPAATPTAAPSATPKPTTTPRPDTGAGAGGAGGATIPPGLLGGALGVLGVVGLYVLMRRWLARARSLPAVWRRVSAFGALLGVRRRASETFPAYARRLSAALPPDTVTLLHRDGSAEVGPLPVRARVVAALEQIAAATGKAEFSAEGLSEREAVQWRRAWERVERAIPLLVWRSLLARGPAAPPHEFGPGVAETPGG